MSKKHLIKIWQRYLEKHKKTHVTSFSRHSLETHKVFSRYFLRKIERKTFLFPWETVSEHKKYFYPVFQFLFLLILKKYMLETTWPVFNRCFFRTLQDSLKCKPVINDAFIIWRAWVVFARKRWALYISIVLCLCTIGGWYPWTVIHTNWYPIQLSLLFAWECSQTLRSTWQGFNPTIKLWLSSAPQLSLCHLS